MSKRKNFNRNDNEPVSEIDVSTISSPVLNESIPINKTVAFGANPSGHRNYDFSSYYGNGFDAITTAAQQTIEIMLSQNTVAVSTVTSYCHSGFNHFAAYLAIYHAALKRPLCLADITPELLENYIHHLKVNYPNGGTAKNYYGFTKAILVGMQANKWLARFRFPRSPFPNSNRKTKGQRTFSRAERKRVTQALKVDINDILKKSEQLSGYELTVCLLAIALRSGMNTTPLLEMTVDAIQSHPLKDDRKLFVLYKRRGNATHIQSLRHSHSVKNAQTVLADVAVIIAHIIKCNQDIRAEIGSDLVLVYRSLAFDNKGEVASLSSNLLLYNINKWIKSIQLKDDTGNPLVINISRFRKTFANRIYELSGGDPFITARMSNHTVSVSDQHYLEAPKEAEKNFNFMGKIREQELLGNVVGIEENTPVSKCSRSPYKNTNGDNIYCTSFLSCVRCQNMVVTKEDLYRLFSFYWLIVSERKQVGAKRWKTYFAHIIRIIERDIAPKFDQEYVKQTKEKARNKPHPAWKNRQQLGEIA